jgi:hypothetical protein
MSKRPFDRSEHIYRNDAFAELVKDAIRFFNGTPVHDLPLPARFLGSGVYALYYTGANPLYTQLADANRLAYDVPIYVGKAVPKGWRQGRVSDSALTQSNELHSRVNEHKRNIEVGAGLEVENFACRFVIFEETGSDMISTIEAALIKLFRPLWNTSVDGFGNHTPGARRFEQAKSDWDVIHPGRGFADRCKGTPKTEAIIHKNIAAHLAKTLK